MEETTEITEINHLEIVQQCIADFSSGNIPGVLDVLTKDVQWTDPGNVADLYVGLRSGKAAVEDFFSKLTQHLNMTQFVVDDYIAKGKKVVANGHCSGTALATGKSFATDFSATWRVNKKGKVNRHQLHLDTYNIAQAMGLAG